MSDLQSCVSASSISSGYVKHAIAKAVISPSPQFSFKYFPLSVSRLRNTSPFLKRVRLTASSFNVFSSTENQAGFNGGADGKEVKNEEVKQDTNGNDDTGGWFDPIELDAASERRKSITQFFGRLFLALSVAAAIAAAGYTKYKPLKHLKPALPIQSLLLKFPDKLKDSHDSQTAPIEDIPIEQAENKVDDSLDQSLEKPETKEEAQESTVPDILIGSEKSDSAQKGLGEEEDSFSLDNLMSAMVVAALDDETPSDSTEPTEEDNQNTNDATVFVVVESREPEITSIIESTTRDVPSTVSSPDVLVEIPTSETSPGPSPPAPLFAPTAGKSKIKVGAGNSESGQVGRVLVAPKLDPSHVQLFQALQAVKVIEEDVDPSSVCTRRQYARWLLASTNILNRDMGARIFPAMYVEGLTQLAFDDISPEDPDFSSIQGLAECGLVASKLSQSDLQCDRSKVSGKAGCMSEEDGNGRIKFHPDSALSRQDLISWRVALTLHSSPILSGLFAPSKASDAVSKVVKLDFLDLERIHSTAIPAIAKDLEAGHDSIIASAFGFTRRFEPAKPVTCVQAAISLSLGEHSEALSEELSRIEAEQIAEAAIQAVAEEEMEHFRVQIRNIEQEKEVMKRERELVEKAAMETKQKLNDVLQDREKEWQKIQSTKTAIEAERRLLQHLRLESEMLVTELEREKERVDVTNKKAAEVELAKKEQELEAESLPEKPLDPPVENFVVAVAVAVPVKESSAEEQQVVAEATEVEEGRNWKEAATREFKTVAAKISEQVSKISKSYELPSIELPKEGAEKVAQALKDSVKNAQEASVNGAVKAAETLTKWKETAVKDTVRNVQKASSAGKSKAFEALAKLKEKVQSAADSITK